MTQMIERRDWLRMAASLALANSVSSNSSQLSAAEPGRWNDSIKKGLDWLSRTQSSRGQWNTQVYPTAIAALAGPR